MKIKSRKGFTMLELTFVIVIIGIVSAVAIPKFLETSNQTNNSIIIAFVGTLNRNVAPAIWLSAKEINGVKDVLAECSVISKYTHIPIQLIDNGDCTFTAKPGSGTTLNIVYTMKRVPQWIIQ